MIVTLKNKILKEMTIVFFVNMCITLIMLSLTLPDKDRLPLIDGPESAGFGIFPFTLIFIGTFAPIMTKVIKKQIESNLIDISKDIKCFLPKNIFIKTFLLLSICLVIVAPFYLYIVSLVLGIEVSYFSAWIINIIYTILLTISVVPIVISCAAKV